MWVCVCVCMCVCEYNREVDWIRCVSWSLSCHMVVEPFQLHSRVLHDMRTFRVDSGLSLSVLGCAGCMGVGDTRQGHPVQLYRVYSTTSAHANSTYTHTEIEKDAWLLFLC